MQKKVIIIGGGIAGLSAACLAVQNGFRVELYEENDKIGGGSQFSTLEGFTFDENPKLFPAPYLFDALIKTQDNQPTISNHFSVLSPTAQIIFADGKKMRFVSETELVQTTQTDQGIPPLTGDVAYQKLDRILEEILNRFSSRKTLNWQQITPHKKENLQQLLLPNILQFSSDPYFQQSLLTLAASSGIPIPALRISDLFLPALIRKSGLFHPLKGMETIIEILQAHLINSGVKIITHTRVIEIFPKQKNTIGIRLADQTQQWADFLLNTTAALAPQTMQFSDEQPMMVIHLGVKDSPALNNFFHQNILILNNNIQAWNTKKNLSIHWLPDYLYIQQPTLSNPDLAPQGSSLLAIRFPIPAFSLENREKEIIRVNILNMLEEKFIPGFKQSIRMENVLMPGVKPKNQNAVKSSPIKSAAYIPAFLLNRNQRLTHMHQYYDNRQPTIPVILFALQQWIESIAHP